MHIYWIYSMLICLFIILQQKTIPGVHLVLYDTFLVNSTHFSLKMSHHVEARLVPPESLSKIKDEQISMLERHFRQCRNPSETDVILIAAETGLSERETVVSVTKDRYS